MRFFQFKKALLALMALGLTAAQAQAALVAPTFDSADAIAVGTAVLTGMALIWAIKKAIGMAR